MEYNMVKITITFYDFFCKDVGKIWYGTLSLLPVIKCYITATYVI